MIRGGDGKLKGKRNRRISLAMQKDWRFTWRINGFDIPMVRSNARSYTYAVRTPLP